MCHSCVKCERNFIGHPVFSRYTRIDHIELKKLHRLRQNIHVAMHPLFGRALLAKSAEFPWQRPSFEAETTAYEWIDGQGVRPKFLGHFTEAGRVIVFVMETTRGPFRLETWRPAKPF